MDDSVGQESLHNVDEIGSACEIQLHSTCTDEVDQSYTYAEHDSMPSAVLQTNGEFMCSSCGVVMKGARAIKRHISTHTSLQTFQSTTSYHNTADKTPNVYKGNVIRNPLKRKQVGESKRLPKLDSNNDGSRQWRSYACKDCDGKFTSRPLVNLHRVQMHRPHKCQTCDMVIIGRRNFSQHVRNEHPGLHISKVPVVIIINIIVELQILTINLALKTF